LETRDRPRRIRRAGARHVSRGRPSGTDLAGGLAARSQRRGAGRRAAPLSEPNGPEFLDFDLGGLPLLPWNRHRQLVYDTPRRERGGGAGVFVDRADKRKTLGLAQAPSNIGSGGSGRGGNTQLGILVGAAEWVWTYAFRSAFSSASSARRSLA